MRITSPSINSVANAGWAGYVAWMGKREMCTGNCDERVRLDSSNLTNHDGKGTALKYEQSPLR